MKPPIINEADREWMRSELNKTEKSKVIMEKYHIMKFHQTIKKIVKTSTFLYKKTKFLMFLAKFIKK